MYESVEVKAGEIISEDWLHYGYFDASNPDASLAQGSERFTRIMVKKTPIATGQKFCDLGCGLGAPALMLAAERGCSVHGVTISVHQQRAATRKAQESALDHLVTFHLEDARKLPFADEFFDGGWFFESISHMGHEKALREAKRVLKQGAILLIADFYLAEDAETGFKEYAQEEMHSCFILLDEYRQILKRCGFAIKEMDDVTGNVGEPFPRKFAEAFQRRQRDIAHLVGEEEIRKWLAHHESIASNTGYITIVAEAT